MVRVHTYGRTSECGLLAGVINDEHFFSPGILQYTRYSKRLPYVVGQWCSRLCHTYSRPSGQRNGCTIDTVVGTALRAAACAVEEETSCRLSADPVAAADQSTAATTHNEICRMDSRSIIWPYIWPHNPPWREPAATSTRRDANMAERCSTSSHLGQNIGHHGQGCAPSSRRRTSRSRCVPSSSLASSSLTSSSCSKNVPA
jgi:hypothetical protein